MDAENQSRADLALPNPQGPSSVSEIELLDVSPRDKILPENPWTWQTFLKKELEFLGVTQILVALICLCFGIAVCSTFDISDFDEEIFSSFRAGYPFWGAVLFAISGFLSIMSEKKNAMYLVRGSLGANAVSSISAGTATVILTLNLSSGSVYISSCEDLREDDGCFLASFITEVVAMLLFLTILGFCSAVSLTIYGIGEEFKGNRVPDDRLYEELNIYSPIYSELEDKGEMPSHTDS
uniref:Membrane-spanning 4-domains, subfamily A, member 2 n=1 Tax=Jaculus jaculus TaxID=51337 RepID=A0A8C5KYR8_JACJA